ncbi:MAG: glycosyltransferase family 4 protein [Bacteroidota bacterium]|nr:glycosyltransferase family 4 protein [Bacteroidota bacterium]
MKTLIIGSRIPYPLHDGGAIATYNMLKGLSEAGVEVHYYSINTKKHFVDDATIKKQFAFLRNIKTFYIDTDIKLMPALRSLISGKSYNLERFYDLNFENDLIKYIQSHQFDLIHFEGLYVAYYAFKIVENSNAPIVLRQHNIEYKIWETLAANTKAIHKKILFGYFAKQIKRFETNFLNLFDGIVTIAKTDEKIIKEHQYINLLTTIPAGIENNFVQQESRVNSKYVYHIGSMEWMPNQQAMLWFAENVWKLVIQKVPDAQFYMAGKNMAEKFKLLQTDNFHVIGEVKDLKEFIADKSILVVPLMSGSGIRIKTIEGLFAKKAIVSTSIGAKGIDVIDRQDCMIADDPETFANAVIEMIQNPSLRQEIAENGYQLAIENYDNQNVSKLWLAFYKKVMDEFDY